MNEINKKIERYTFEQLADNFFKHMEKIEKLSHNTLKGYKSNINVFVKFCTDNGLNHLNDIDDIFYDEYLYTLENDAPNTFNRKKAAIFKFYNYLLKKGLTEQKSFIEETKSQKIPHRIPDALTEPQFYNMLEIIDYAPKIKYNDEAQNINFRGQTYDNSVRIIKKDLKDGKGKRELYVTYEKDSKILTPIQIRNRAMICVLLTCGLRAEECVNLRVSNIINNGTALQFKGKGNKERITPLGPETKNAIDRWLSNSEKRSHGDTDFIFTSKSKDGVKHISKDVATNEVKKYMSMINVYIPKRPVHKLRKSYASFLNHEGFSLLEIASYMGHENTDVTQKNYIMSWGNKNKETIDAFSKAFSKAKGEEEKDIYQIDRNITFDTYKS